MSEFYIENQRFSYKIWARRQRHMKNAIVMAAGKGTRMRSEQPKVLHKILDEPMAGLIVNNLKKTGAERIVAVVGYGHELVEAALAGQCEFAVQEPQLGTGHAVMQAHQLENETGLTVVVNGDGPCVSPETYQALYDALVDAEMAIMTAEPEYENRFGRVIRNEDGTVEKIVEYKDCTEAERAVKETNMGFYAFRNELLFTYLKEIKNNNAQKEYYITDLVEIFRNHGCRVAAVKVEDCMEVQGVNDNIELARASKYLQERINTKLMSEGVTLVDPDSAYIGPEVTFGHDVTVHPNVYLYGKTAIGDNAVILPGSYLRDARIEDGEIIGPNVYSIPSQD